jgi:Fe-S-cluster containining protein
MKGTNSKHNGRCIALTGEVGKKVACGIYEWRPSPCRNFMASYENGYHNPRCDEARAKYGLRPLVKSDFPAEYRKKIENIDGQL